MSERPSYYQGASGADVIDILTDRGMHRDFLIGCGIKHLLRFQRKPALDPCEDLEKAVDYITRLLAIERAAKVPAEDQADKEAAVEAVTAAFQQRERVLAASHSGPIENHEKSARAPFFSIKMKSEESK